MSGYEDLSGEGFVDGMPDFLKALSEDDSEDVAAELHEEWVGEGDVYFVALQFTMCDRRTQPNHHTEDRPAFRPIVWQL